MTHMLPLLSALACLAIMFGTAALVWLATKTPLRRVPAIARRAQSRPDGATDQSRA
jgi:hypothetical protein